MVVGRSGTQSKRINVLRMIEVKFSVSKKIIFKCRKGTG
jgi:hypothetical protein